MRIIEQLAQWMLRTRRMSGLRYCEVRSRILGIDYDVTGMVMKEEKKVRDREADRLRYEGETERTREKWWSLRGAKVRPVRTKGSGETRPRGGRETVKVRDLDGLLPSRLMPFGTFPLAGLLARVGAACGCAGMTSSWGAFAAGVERLYALEADALHDALRLAAIKDLDGVCQPLLADQAGRTLFPDGFLEDLSGEAVTVLRARVAGEEQAFFAKKSDWVLAARNINVLNRACLVRNRLRHVFRRWMREAAELIPVPSNPGEAYREAGLRFDLGGRRRDLPFARIPRDVLTGCGFLLAEPGRRTGRTLVLPEGLWKIEENVFTACEDLETLALPASLAHIGRGNFEHCPRLKEVRVARGNPVFRCEDGWLVDGTDGRLVLSVASNLSGRAEVPACVKSVPDTLLRHAEHLVAISLPGVRHVGRILQDHAELEEVRLGAGVETIDADSLRSCGSLKALSFPKHLLPTFMRALPNLADLVFAGSCDMAFGGYVVRDGLVCRRASWELVSCAKQIEEVRIPEGVTRIPDSFFEGLGALRKVRLPKTLRHIGKWAFASCGCLSSVYMGEGRVTVGRLAFDNCPNLAFLSLPVSPGGLEDLVREVGAGRLFSADGRPLFRREKGIFYRPGTHRMVDWARDARDVTVSEDVSEIPPSFFWKGVWLASVKLPHGLKSIGGGAFTACRRLEDIEIPAGVTKIGNYMFSGCESLETLAIPAGVTEIADGAFMNCSRLRTLEIPAGVTALGSWAFANCESLETLEIPAGVTRIGTCAFAKCPRLTVVLHAPRSLFGAAAFEGCRKVVCLPSGPDAGVAPAA